MNGELEQLTANLKTAHSPEEVFGAFAGGTQNKLAQARHVYQRLAKVAHPDHYVGTPDQAAAHDAFVLLGQWWEAAQARIDAGVYGSADAAGGGPIILQSGKRRYILDRWVAQGELCNLYLGRRAGANPEKAVFKMALDPRDNDLVANEARILRSLWSEDRWAKYQAYLPQLYDSFLYDDGSSVLRQVNVLSHLDGFFSLKEVRKAFREGVDPKDMAWMFRRLLVAVGLAHVNHVLHGAVLPEHVLILPAEHGLVLIDWSCAVAYDDPAHSPPRLRAQSLAYERWYPPEVLAKDPLTPGADIYMAAQCMVYLLGGNPAAGEIPGSVPKALERFFRGCLLPRPAARPQDAWALLGEFDELIGRLWGRRTFRPFVMSPIQ